MKDKSMYSIKDIELMGDNIRDRLKSCGEGVKIFPLAKITHPQNVELGNYCRIADFVLIYSENGVIIGEHSDIQPHTIFWGGGLTILGDRVSTGPGTVFLSATYSHAAGLKMVDGLGEGTAKAIGGKLIVENDVYIGARCVIMPVTIGEGAVIGAGSLVTNDCEAWGIYVGNPARKVGERQKG
jgi:dTDP-4-amino-4,6-dideoxy-D-glucose acyltransferase